MSKIKRGDIYLINLGKNRGSVQSGTRPCIVVSNDVGNTFSTIVSVIPISRRGGNLPTHVKLGARSGLEYDSYALAEQEQTVSQEQIIRKIGRCNSQKMIDIDKSILLQKGIDASQHLKSLGG